MFPAFFIVSVMNHVSFELKASVILRSNEHSVSGKRVIVLFLS